MINQPSANLKHGTVLINTEVLGSVSQGTDAMMWLYSSSSITLRPDYTAHVMSSFKDTVTEFLQ